jgi:hypothetical protein
MHRKNNDVAFLEEAGPCLNRNAKNLETRTWKLNNFLGRSERIPISIKPLQKS